jgi:uncharacterized membrane protein YcaP (DUF421 family)
MNAFAGIDLEKLFVPQEPLLEMVLRGSITYLFIFIALRFLRREASGLGTPDLLFLVIIADAAQSGMAGDARTLTEGLVLVSTIFAWNFILDWLGFRFRWAHKLLIGEPLLLVAQGKIQWKNLRKELLTRDDLLEQLREQEVEDVSEVERCFLEPDGKLSVLKRDKQKDGKPKQDKAQPAGARA